MDRASPVELRKALQVAQELAQAGILFVPVPVLNDADKAKMGQTLQDQLNRIEAEVE